MSGHSFAAKDDASETATAGTMPDPAYPTEAFAVTQVAPPIGQCPPPARSSDLSILLTLGGLALAARAVRWTISHRS